MNEKYIIILPQAHRGVQSWRNRMGMLKRTPVILIATLLLILCYFSFCGEDDTLEPPTQTNNTVISQGSNSSSSEETIIQGTTTEVVGVDLAVDLFVMPASITQVARGYIGGGTNTGFQGRITNHGNENSGAFKVEIRFADYQLPQGDWTGEMVFATVESPELGLSERESIYLPGNSSHLMYYNAFDIPNEKYKVRAVILNMDGSDFQDENNSNNTRVAQKEVLNDETRFVTLKGAGEQQICILADGQADTEMFLFDSGIAASNNRNDSVYTPTDEIDWIYDYEEGEYYSYSSSDQPSPYFISDISYRNYLYFVERYLITTIDDNYKNYTTTNPVICKYLPNGTYYLRVQGTHKGGAQGKYKIQMTSGDLDPTMPFPNGWSATVNPADLTIANNIGPDLGGLVLGGSNAYSLAIGDIYQVAPMGQSDEDASEEEMWFRIGLNRDAYEYDDEFDDAKEIIINDEEDHPFQSHNFHADGDADIVYFTIDQDDVEQKATFGIIVYDVYLEIDPVVEVYLSADLSTAWNPPVSSWSSPVNDAGNGGEEKFSFSCDPDGFADLDSPENVYIKIYDNPPSTGNYTEYGYKLKVIRIPQVALDTPQDESESCNRSTFFKWNSIEGVDSYRIQWSTIGGLPGDFATPEEEVTVDSLNASFSRHTIYEMGVAKYYWRVRGENDLGINGVWSDIWWVDQQMPEKISLDDPSTEPLDEANVSLGSDVYFEWKNASDEGGYELLICDNENFNTGAGGCIDTIEKGVDVNTHTESASSFTTGTTYYWKVRGTNADKDCKQFWTSPYSFTTTP